MTKSQWLASASKLCITLKSEGTALPNSVTKNNYQTLRNVVFKDRHHSPDNTPSNKLLKDVEEWMTEARGTTFDKRFSAS